MADGVAGGLVAGHHQQNEERRHFGVGQCLAIDIGVDQGGGHILGGVLLSVLGQIVHQQIQLLRRVHEGDHGVLTLGHVFRVTVREDDVGRVEDGVVVGRPDTHHVADDLEGQPGGDLDREVAAALVGHSVDHGVGHVVDAFLDGLDHARVEGRRHDPPQTSMARVVHVDHGAEELVHLLGQVDHGGCALARLEDLRVSARLSHVSMLGQGVEAVSLGHDVGQCLGDLRLVEVRQSDVGGAVSGMLPPAPPRAGPRTRCRRDRCRRPPGRHVVPCRPPYPAPYTSIMCDTLCARGPGGMVFAKNSDRPPGEVQITWPFGRRASNGCSLRTQYLTIGDTGAHAVLLSCPTWLWGAEHGVNEYGVAIGNERVGTTHDAEHAKPALIGMDLVRLGLERSRTADGGRRRDDRTARVLRAGWDRGRRPWEGLRLLLPGGRPRRGLRARDGREGLRRRPGPGCDRHFEPTGHRHRVDASFTGAGAGSFIHAIPRCEREHRVRRRPPGGQPPLLGLRTSRRTHGTGRPRRTCATTAPDRGAFPGSRGPVQPPPSRVWGRTSPV